MKRILKASRIMGSSTAISIFTGIIKTKLLAIWLGPQGIGLIAMLQTLQNTASTVTGMGLANSGVRQIAASQGENSDDLREQSQAVLWWISLLLGVVGFGCMALFSKTISRISFGNGEFAFAVAVIGVGVWATNVAGAHIAILNGTHRLKEIAKSNVLSGVISAVIAIIAVWSWDTSGIIAVVIGPPLILMAVSGWYLRNTKHLIFRFSLLDSTSVVNSMISLGFVFMLTALMGAVMQYLTRAILIYSFDISAAGFFQSAWTITMLYLGFILKAMETDYYPRLAEVSENKQAVSEMANQQVEASFLLAGPVILGMITLAPNVTALLYSKEFFETAEILRWQLLGCFFKLATHALGYILIVSRKNRWFFITESYWNIVYLLSLWFGIPYWGMGSAGISFLIAYLTSFLLISWIVGRKAEFTWHRANLCLLLIFVCSGSVIMSLHSFMNHKYVVFFGLVFTIIASCYSVLRLSEVIYIGNLGKLSRLIRFLSKKD
ncbi:O-antigen translocase [Sporomusa sp.]|uniref:O-antigen translocase n=1 Tax=Sporomusa sp. TaxID=2078658 RepID=UPI002C4AAF34|nr:O-antigen translocase [Sporomusa sp.]HWR45839.1 O-antigen translocase [Sporomusa sp.]